MVVCSEKADELERTAEGIAEDEKADQQNDNSRPTGSIRWLLREFGVDLRSTAILLSCAKLGKCLSFCREKFLFIHQVVS